jgi:transposase
MHSHVAFGFFVCLLRFAPRPQEYCTTCHCRLNAVQRRRRLRHCDSCRERVRSTLASISPPAPFTSSNPPIHLSDRNPSSSQHLTEVERSAAVTLLRVGKNQREVAEQLSCSRQTVAKWKRTYEQTGQVHEAVRSGRPRITSELEDVALAAASAVQPFDTPRRLKGKLEMDASAHTIDRRLKEAELNGRVAIHTKELSEEHKRKRLSFAEGYRHWTEKNWERVLFSDEKLFYGAGFCGRVWVRRPPGEALNEKYCVDKKPHPVKVNMWGCFTARGLGYCYLFNESLDARLLKRVLGTHLLPSAQLHFQQHPPEQWWFLQDNDPKHSSREIRSWLHNNGIHCLDFPPHSPDLNPMENLWNDLARRVETKQAETVERLQDVVAAEWAATSTDVLVKLAHSMPKRCEAVIDAKGGHTNY